MHETEIEVKIIMFTIGFGLMVIFLGLFLSDSILSIIGALMVILGSLWSKMERERHILSEEELNEILERERNSG